MMLKAAFPSATSFDASCHVSDAASEFVYESSSLKRLSDALTSALPQLPPFFHSADHLAGPSFPIMTVSSRCFCVHCSASASGITPAFFAFFSAVMNSPHVFGAALIPALRRTAGLYQRMFARWMFTGTE